MIENYGVFNHHEIDNTLLILFDERKSNRIEKHGLVDVLYFNEQLVGYSISNFIRFVKIKYSGIIFLPNNYLIDAINAILNNEKLETLAYKKSSGYEIRKINDKIVVYATNGTFLRDETISNGRICTFFDLYINAEDENEIVTVDDESLLNHDFFQMESKIC